MRGRLMVYDCITFFNELDLLEIRLNTLSSVVDKFIIAEATRTHSGKPKDLVFDRCRDRFADFADRITYVVVEDLLSEEEIAQDPYNLPWVNENRHRNALMRGLEGASTDDVVMVSDLDEIPRPETVGHVCDLLQRREARAVRFEMEFFNYYLNFKNFSYAKWMLGTVATRFSEFSSPAGLMAKVKTDRYTQASENIGNTFNKLRFVKADVSLPDSGWHFSYLGGIESIRRKLSAFAHTEFNDVPVRILEQRLKSGEDLFGRAGCSFGVSVDETFPRYVQENRSTLSELIFPVDEDYLNRTEPLKRRAIWRGRVYAAMVKMTPRFLAPMAVRVRDAVMKIFRRD